MTKGKVTMKEHLILNFETPAGEGVSEVLQAIGRYLEEHSDLEVIGVRCGGEYGRAYDGMVQLDCIRHHEV